MDLIAILVIVLGISYIIYIVIESFLIKFYRKHIKCIIHVNGIRGKSTITRLIDSGLREFNFKVMSKVTGTIPTILDINNNEIEIIRRGPANIREQIRILKKAYKDQVDYLVIECMAVDPSLQKVLEENILKANITVISNVRMDHIGEMGDSLEELALALSNTTPTNGYLIIDKDNQFKEIFNKKCDKNNSKLLVSEEYNGETFETFKDNIEEALMVANALNLDKDKFLKGLSKYKHDVGALSELKLNDSLLINGFSINDIDSIKIVYDELSKKHNLSDLTILLNNRSDRPTRTKILLDCFKYVKCKKIILTGDSISYSKHYLNKNYPDIEVTELINIKDLENEKLIFAIGNIKNKGMEILDYYKKGGE